MTAAYDLAEWHDCFVAIAGASAALAGLVFVAVSINIDRILDMPGAADRGLQTVLLLLGALVASVFGLVPQQVGTFGVELLVASLVLLGWFAFTARVGVAGTRGHPLWLASRLGLVAGGSIPYLIGSVSLLARAGGGLGWVVAGLVGALIGAVINAWVLLVEILR